MGKTRLALGIIVVLAVIVGLLLIPAPAGAEGITIVESSVEHSFAQQVTFSVSATSTAEISEVYLFFGAEGDDKMERTSVTVERPAPEISVRHTHDVSLYPLSPFATITFWWQLEDVDGNRLKTAPKQFKYTDNRFEWRRASAGGISVYWIEGQGDPAYVQTALDIAQASVNEINAELHAPLPNPLDIYIYDSGYNLEAAMVLAGREWVGGQARPELGVVTIAVPPEQGYVSRMKRYLPHEITHLLVYEAMTPESYRWVPTWLDEGLATANEHLPTAEFALALDEAYAANQLVPLADLCVPFSPDPQRAVLSYAQSASVVSFIRDQYGAEGIRRLLSAYADGASCANAVEEALGVGLTELESAWQASLRSEGRWRAWADQVDVWIGLWLLSVLVAVPMIGRIHRQRSPGDTSRDDGKATEWAT